MGWQSDLPWETTENYIRSGHRSTSMFQKGSHRTITINSKRGIKAVVACPKGKYSSGRCQTGMVVQSYLFPKSKGWTMQTAKAWFKSKEKNSLIDVMEWEDFLSFYLKYRKTD
jgi:hypothetical protein